MTVLHNMKIGTKLIVGFIVVAVIASIVGVVGVINIYRINKQDSELYHLNVIPLEQIAEIEENFLKSRANMRDILLDKDPVNCNNKARQIQENLKIMQTDLDNFDKTLQTEQGKNNSKRLSMALEAYESYINKRLALIQNQQFDVAYQLSMTDGAKIDAEIEQCIDTLMEQKIQLANEKNKSNNDIANNAELILLCLVIGGVALAIILGLYITKLISKPIRELVTASQKIAHGDLKVDIDVNANDEIGVLAQAFKQMSENINRALSNIYVASQQVSSGSRQVATTSQALSQGATEQASSIEEVTSSMAEIAAQTKQNAMNAMKTNEMATVTKESAEHGNQQMTEMIAAMGQINEASNNIAKIIKVIDEIAFQTNILALNAAVEAARAGQHGKGFAVVAEEVRNLAARSANAAKETTALIESSIEKVQEGSQIANTTGKSLKNIVDEISKVADVVSEIAGSCNEQATAIAQINQAIEQVSQVVQTNSATAEESAAASEELSSQADILISNVRKFQLKETEDKLTGVCNVGQPKEHTSEKELDSYESQARTKAKPRIILDDNDFGKY